MNILFDGNYLVHKSFSVFSTYYRNENMEDVLANTEKRQVLIRKCVIDMCYCINKFHNVKRVAFVIDSSSWRYNFYKDYKYALTRVREPYYKYFLQAINEFEDLLRRKGIIVSRVQGAEGDDLLYVWSVYFGYCLDEKLVIVTGDSDIRQIITKNVSIFNNNSKNLKLYCSAENEVFWNEYIDTDVTVEVVNPFEILLRKVIMGDSSDNIPKMRNGFGEKAFEKFLSWINKYEYPVNVDIVDMAQWITSKFSEYLNVPQHDLFNGIYFNLQMTWLNLSVYNTNNYVSENGKTLLENMLDDVAKQKDNFSYNKVYSLEEFYGMVMK